MGAVAKGASHINIIVRFSEPTTYFDDGYWLALKISEPDDIAAATEFCAQAPEKCMADIRKYRKKRSLDANAYFWLLCGKLAMVLRQPKEDIYRRFIKDIGDNFEILQIRDKAVDKWVSNWESRGLGWLCDNLGPSENKGYTNIVNYFGSSTYDTRQMAALIDMVIFECQLQDIPTETPKEIEKKIRRWRPAA